MMTLKLSKKSFVLFFLYLYTVINVAVFQTVDTSSKLQTASILDVFETLYIEVSDNVLAFEILCLSISTYFIYLTLKQKNYYWLTPVLFYPIYYTIFATQSAWGVTVSLFIYAVKTHPLRSIYGFLFHPGAGLLLLTTLKHKSILISLTVVLMFNYILIDQITLLSDIHTLLKTFSIQKTHGIDTRFFLVILLCLVILRAKYRQLIKVDYLIYFSAITLLIGVLGFTIIFYRLVGVYYILVVFELAEPNNKANKVKLLLSVILFIAALLFVDLRHGSLSRF